ncbi:MAG: hypothetical protein U0271_15230 [Polyangiaceae bacterium]
MRVFGAVVRRDERVHVAVASLYLIGLVGSHTALETARDALFLGKISNTRLPIVYIVIAILSFATARARDLFRSSSLRRELALWTANTGLGTIALGLVAPRLGDAGLYVLYVWSGVVTSLILVHFWTLLGDVFSPTQAKRVYTVISLGAMVGAVVGSASVALTAQLLSPRKMVVVAGVGFLLSAALPRLLPRRAYAAPARVRPVDPLLERFRANIVYVTRGRYVWRLVGVAVLGSATVTVADYLFKSTIVANVPTSELATAFGRTYLLLNASALFLQLFIVGWVLRRLAPSRVIVALPALLVISGGSLAAFGGVTAAVATKGIDGSLRHGLHRTGMELLTIPLSEDGRRKVKTALEIVGQRGGQVIASGLILGATALALPPRLLAISLTGLALAWTSLAILLHPYYVEQFRSSIVGDRGRPRARGGLGATSLEALVAALDSDVDADVLASLDALEHEEKLHLVTNLVVFHASEAVVIAALRAFARARRKLPKAALAHLASHASARVRAEAHAFRVAFEPPAALGRLLETETEPAAIAAVTSAMVASGALALDVGRARLLELVKTADDATKIVLAEMIAWHRVGGLDRVVGELAESDDAAVRRAAIASLGALRTPHAAEVLVGMLGGEQASGEARRALVAAGPEAFAALSRALADVETPRIVRWSIPRALALVDPRRAAETLLANLPVEPDGLVRYRSLVALTAIVERQPDLKLPRDLIERELAVHVSRAYRYLDRRLALAACVRSDPSLATPGLEFLMDLLQDKESNAIGRVFRVLSLAFPQHRFGTIYRAIENGERLFRAGAVELTQNLLSGELRSAVVGLVDELDDDVRLTYAGSYHTPIDRSFDAVIEILLGSRSAIVRDSAAYVTGELRLKSRVDQLEQLIASGLSSRDVSRALLKLSDVPVPSLRGNIISILGSDPDVG